jgi:hypothetical protein
LWQTNKTLCQHTLATAMKQKFLNHVAQCFKIHQLLTYYLLYQYNFCNLVFEPFVISTHFSLL